MIVELVLDIDGPLDEATQQIEVFTTLNRLIDISITPFTGMYIRVTSNLTHPDSRAEQYGKIFQLISDPTAMFCVEKVICSIASEEAPETIQLVASPVFEPTTSQFHAYVKFLTNFYGFTQSRACSN